MTQKEVEDIDCYDLKSCDGDCDECDVSPDGAKWVPYAEKYKEQAKSKGRYEEMIYFLSGSEDKRQLHDRAVVFILSPQYERSDICLALKAVERDKGWRP